MVRVSPLLQHHINLLTKLFSSITVAQSILVIPGTGKQGRLATTEFLKRGFKVHDLIRDPSSTVARALVEEGATLHPGDLGNQQSIENALEDVDTIFLSLPAHPKEFDFASNVVNAAKKKNIRHVIYTSVARTGQHESFPFWSGDYPMAGYWKTKHEVETLLRKANFEFLTILRPAFFMQNFCGPEVKHMFPGLADTKVLTLPFDPDTTFDLIDVLDIAKVAAAAAENPQQYAGKEIELASEKLTANEIARSLSKVSGEEIKLKLISKKESAERIKQGDMVMLALEFQRDTGYAVNLDEAKSPGIEFTPLSEALLRESLQWST